MNIRLLALTFALLVCYKADCRELTPHVQNNTVIALAPHIVELLYDIGAGPQIIATSSFADYPIAAKSLPRVGDHSRLQIEKIVQMRPDLIIAWRSGNPLDDLARLEKYGLKVVYSDPKSLEDIATEIEWLGELTGNRSKSLTLSAAYRERLAKIQQSYRDKTPVSVFYEIWPSPLQTISGNAWPQRHLELCGANNIFSIENNDYPAVSSEQVLTHLPQVIIQPTANDVSQNAHYDWSKYTFLPAVNNGFIFHPNADKVHRMTTRVLDEVELMCEEIERARQFYQAR